MSNPAVFISYSREDLEAAVQLEKALKDAGLTVWRDQESLYAGQQWPKALGEAISSNDYILLLWSKSSADSHFVEFEWTTAIALRKTIVPCMVDDTPLVPALISFNGIPFKDPETTIERILQTIKLTKPAARADKKRDSSVLKKLQEVIPDDPEKMARVGTMMISRAMKEVGEEGKPVSDPSMTVSQMSFDGMTIGDRYQVVKMLGRGGMGAVYQVYDTELERDAALKVIRSDMADEPMVIQRFKREIQLSSEVTHRNVLRVYDLGEADGVKFLTMQYVEGEELTDILKREGKLKKDRLVKILRQMAQGLAAAHEKAVIHRDLKPANILIDAVDHVFITDFGLATTQAQSGLTQAGDVMGTPHYMSPEQVKGEPADAQSDIYSLGVILYEMATGQLPFTGNTIFEIMMQRTVKDPEPAKKVNPEIPDFVDKIIQGCTARDKSARYASVEELLEDLEEGALSGQTIMMTRLRMRSIKRKASLLTWKKLAMAVPLILVLLFGLWSIYDQIAPGDSPRSQVAEMVQHDPVTVLVGDFANETDDKVFSGLLEQTIGSALEGASFVTTFNRGRARQIGGQLKEGAEVLDDELSRLVAQREGIAVVVTGALVKQGDSYAISVRAIDSLTGEAIESGELEVDERDDVLNGLSRLAARIRNTLGDTTPESAQLVAAETFTSSSLEASQNYAKAQELQGAGAWEQAIDLYKKAIDLDSRLGRAYAGLGIMYSNLDRGAEADEQFQLAMRFIDRMAERERYKTRGTYFAVTGNHSKAVEELSELVKRYPADFSGYNNLAWAHFQMRNMDGAFEAARAATRIYPNNVVMRSNLALYAMYAGDFEAAVDEAESVLEIDPSYENNYVCLALSQLGAGKTEDARQAYSRLSELSPLGKSLASVGLADVAMYEGLFSEAVKILGEGIAEDQKAGDDAAVGRKMVALARAYISLNQKTQALVQAERMVSSVESAPLLFEAAEVFIDAGRPERAVEIAEGIEKSIRSENQLYAKLIRGEVQLAAGEVWDAIRTLNEAQAISDSWPGRFALGRAYLQASAFAEANSELDQANNRRGEATAILLDDIPSYYHYPAVLYYLGQSQQGLQSAGAADTFRTFLEIKQKSEADPLVEAARERLAELGG